nr:hypothetical protein [uncultured Treponema sp.]
MVNLSYMRYSASTAKWLEICKKIKKYFVADNIGKISYLSPQNAITSNSEAKSIRLDVLAKDDRGISYDKVSEQMRKEYRILPAVIMDAIDEGVERGKSLGLAEGEARGSRQAKLETAKNLLNIGLSRENIAKATGLSRAEVEAIQ